VRPNSGKIEPSASVEVQVLLQAMKEQPAPDARCRDKFLVQSVAIAPNTAAPDGSNISQIWSNIEQTAKSSIQEKKIKVNFLPADSGAQTNGVVGGGAQGHEDDQPPAYSSPSPSQAAVTPSRDVKSDGDTSVANSTMLGGAAAGLGGAAAAVSNSIPRNQEDLQAQLDSANAQIAKLKEQAAEGLRQRKPQEAAQKAVDSVQQSLQNAPAPGGVPIQYVAALCLLCFLIAWMFF
jgi:hypothetical protein